MDDEVKGNGNSYTTVFRQYDPRIGRWLSLDPLTAQFPWQSPYCAFDNNPILYNDPLGLAAKGGPPTTMPKDSKIGDKSKDGLWEVEDVGDGVLNWVKNGGEIEEIVVKPNKKSESNSNFQQTLKMFDSYRTSLFFSELDKRQKEWEAHNPFKFGNSWESYVNEDKLIRPWNYSPQSIQACDWFWQLFIGPISSSATTSTTLSESIAFTTENVAAKTSTSLWPAASGGRTFINGIEYTTHALERMQPVGTIMKGATSYSRGIPPSIVENAVKFGKITPGNTTAEVVRTFYNVRVITNPAGTRVISVFKIGN